MKQLICYVLRQEEHCVNWKLKRQWGKNEVTAMINNVKGMREKSKRH